MRWVEIPIEVWLRECVLVSDSDVTVPELDEPAAVELNFHQKGEMCPGLVSHLKQLEPCRFLQGMKLTHFFVAKTV